MTLLEEQVADLNERFTAQESHFEGLRSALLELRRDLMDRPVTHDADVLALRQRIDGLEKNVTGSMAEMHRSFQMLLDRRDVMLLQRGVNETMKRVQELKEELQQLEAGQQELKEELQQVRQTVLGLEVGQQELRDGQQQIQQTLQQILAKLG